MNWISVKDRLPEVNKDVLVATRSLIKRKGKEDTYFRYVHIAALTPEGNDWFYQGDDIEASFYERIEITHWMPTPEPPEHE